MYVKTEFQRKRIEKKRKGLQLNVECWCGLFYMMDFNLKWRRESRNVSPQSNPPDKLEHFFVNIFLLAT